MLKRILIPISILVIVAVVLIIARETREIIILVSAAHPLLGQALLWFLLTLYGLCILIPVVTFFRLPRGLLPPSAEDVDAQKVFLEKLARRLCRNRNLTNREVTPKTIPTALEELGKLAGSVRLKRQQLFL